MAEAWWSLANLKTWRFAPADIRAMEASLPVASPPAQAHLLFALGKAREDAGAFEQAFANYARANALRRAAAPFDIAAHEAFVDAAMAACDSGLLQGGQAIQPAAAPIFVLGLPRTGTTLVEQILASHSDVEGAGELPDVQAIASTFAGGGNYPGCLARLSSGDRAVLGANYLGRTELRRPLALPRFVDKFPGNWLHVPLIALMLPGARIVEVRRDPLDTCVSLFTQNFAAGQAWCYDLETLGRYWRSYDRLMALLAARLQGRIHRIHYEKLVENTEPEIRRLLTFCDLGYQPQCLQFHQSLRPVRTPSSEQVRQPITNASIGRWRRFEPWLGPLLQALDPAPARQ
jgi:hypothetical protein